MGSRDVKAAHRYKLWHRNALLRGATRRSNPQSLCRAMDCFAVLAMTGTQRVVLGCVDSYSFTNARFVQVMPSRRLASSVDSARIFKTGCKPCAWGSSLASADEPSNTLLHAGS